MSMHKSTIVPAIPFLPFLLFCAFTLTTHAMASDVEPVNANAKEINRGFANAVGGTSNSPIKFDETTKQNDAKPPRPDADAKKFDRGVDNALQGLWELPIKIHDTTQQTDLFQGLTTGAARGVGLAIARIGTGLYEMATFWVPQEKGYEVLIQPEKPALARKLNK
ncbi:MAG: putative exosortase-associated protein (TIGR04073 family) [Candidatus Omnitrophota bacterium]|jgi:putative exosortase-associated protein (TIGR04073 family)